MPSDAGQTATESYNYSAGTVASDGTVSVSCTPTSVYNIKCGPGVGYYAAGAANAAYKATALPITINLTGTTPDSSGNQNILVGQGCTASVSGIPPDLLNNTTHPPVYNWSISGTTFQTWQSQTPAIGDDSANLDASYYVTGPGPLNNSTARWFWNDLHQTQETVYCTVTLTPPDGQGSAFTVTASDDVIVMRPLWTATGTGGYVKVNLYPGTNNYEIYAGPTASQFANGQTGGMNFAATVTSPDPSLFGNGSLELAQLVTPDLSFKTVEDDEYTYSENGQQGSDGDYPYGWTRGGLNLD